jgi:CubicO group peptidase (beta-lactamase class C family)
MQQYTGIAGPGVFFAEGFAVPFLVMKPAPARPSGRLAKLPGDSDTLEKTMQDRAVQGQCSERFAPLRELLQSQLDSGASLGASLAVVVEGEPAVDLWGGWADEAQTRPWASDTVVNVWSTTKTMSALAALLLVDRGELDVDKPVAHYWPEFAAAGKGGVTPAHFLCHSSGVSGWERPVKVEDLYDWERSTARLAAQAPWWAPGTATGYHAFSYGHLIGELVRRISGRGLKQFFAEEIARPLQADFHIGLPESAAGRCSPVLPPPPLQLDAAAMDKTSVMYKTFAGPAPSAQVANTPAWRAADIGGANGHGNTRSVARIQSLMSNGGEVGGVRLLRPQTIERVFATRNHGRDLVLGLPLRMGLGWALPEPGLLSYIPQGRICYWGGWGGSMVINDADRRVTMAYMMNRMAGGLLGSEVSDALLARTFSLLGA